MVYYNTKGQLVDFSLESPILHGTSANIYPIRDTLYFKKYYPSTPEALRMNYEMFPFFKKLNHPFICQVMDLYYAKECNKEEHLFLDHLTAGYTFQFIEEMASNLLEESVDFLIYNLENLERLMGLFTENQVKAQDLKKDNTVFSEHRIILIDLDSCRRVQEEKAVLQRWNQLKLKQLFLELFRRSASYSFLYDKKVQDLFFVEEGKLLIDEVKRRLIKYKNPLNYLKDN